MHKDIAVIISLSVVTVFYYMSPQRKYLQNQFLRRSSVGTIMKQASDASKPKTVAPKLDYKSMVSVNDMPELFASLDSKLLLMHYNNTSKYIEIHFCHL